MRDTGLNDAIRAVGGVSELARRIGISQPAVTNWERVPAERVLAVEAATGVPRIRLRPDLYDETPPATELDEIDAARAQEYALLSSLLVRAPDVRMLERLARLDGDTSPLGLAHRALAEAAANTNAKRVEREYFDLFIGVGRGELMPYGSYYLTGFLYERPLARLRQDLAVLGIANADDNPEPEDHVATLCEIMSGLIAGSFDAPKDAHRRLFDKHMAPWFGRFFDDLQKADAAEFYRAVGTLGRTFIDIESEAFALPG
jgi:TorA maturation chaperone TorD